MAQKKDSLTSNGVVVTSRGGLLGGHLAPPFLPFTIEGWTWSDFEIYVNECKRILPDDVPAGLISSVHSSKVLSNLAHLPLYAKMIVHIADSICRQPQSEFGEFWLIDKFVHVAFSSRKSKMSQENKKLLLKQISLYLFQNGLSVINENELQTIYKSILLPPLSREDLSREVGVFSLMHFDEDVLSYNHPPLHDYFLVNGLLDLWYYNQEKWLEILNGPQALGRTALTLLADRFRETEQSLVEFFHSRGRLQERVAANFFMILLILGEPFKQIQTADFSTVDFSQLEINDVEFIKCKFRRTNLSGAKLYNCQFSSCIFESPILFDAMFDQCNFKKLSIKGFHASLAGRREPQFLSCHFDELLCYDDSRELLQKWRR